MRSRFLLAALAAALAAAAGCGSATPAGTTAGPAAPEPTVAAAPTTATTTGPTTTAGPTTTMATTITRPLGPVIEVPAGSAPVIDGTLDDPAWDTAAVTDVDGGMALLWLVNDGVLYVGVRYDRVGAVNLLIADGDRVRILHASAALGSATHLRDSGTSWSLAADYSWCCRNPASTSQRNALWDEEGWYASLGGVGAPGEVEYAVAGADGMHVAVSWVAGGNEAILWPDDLPDSEAEALTGPRLGEETFDPERWPRLDLGG